MTLASILKTKGHDVITVRATHTIAEVANRLAERRIGAVVVEDAAGQVLGVVSERDIVQGLAAHGAAVLHMTAGQIMTTQIVTASPSTTVSEAMHIMTNGRFRHLPILEAGHLVGIASIGDIVKARLMEQEYEVDSLKAYVAGGA